MKVVSLIILVFTILNYPSRCIADAPVETYFFERNQIPDAILRETKGVLTVRMIDPGFDAEYNQRPEVKNIPPISIFRNEKGVFKKIGILDIAKISTPTGGQYEAGTWYRFPVITRKNGYLEIVYHLHQNKRCWVNFDELTLSSPREKPVLDWFTNNLSSEPVSVDIFFLTRNKERKLYISPIPGSSFQVVTPASAVLKIYGSYDVRSFKVIEQRNGFGHLVAIEGTDMPARKIGWIRLRDENGLLLVWPIMGNL